MPENVHTVPYNGEWANRREGSERVSDTADTKEEAVRVGRDAARRDRVEHFIHNRDGSIAERNSYGADPYPPPG
jgi:hypothetical protein